MDNRSLFLSPVQFLYAFFLLLTTLCFELIVTKANSVYHGLLSRDWQIREIWGFANPPGAFCDLLKLLKTETK
jgi:hypothetical protein